MISLLQDVGVGRLSPADIPAQYVQTGLKMFVERLRRGMCIHPEFSENLSDVDKSLLWKKNFPIAAALSMVKVFLSFYDKSFKMMVKYTYFIVEFLF